MNEVPNEKNMPDEVGTIEDLVQHSLNQDYNKANQVFGNLMTVKMDDMLNQEKVKIADQIYNHLDQENGGDEDDPETEEVEGEETETEAEETEEEGEAEESEEEVIDDEEENDVEGVAV